MQNVVKLTHLISNEAVNNKSMHKMRYENLYNTIKKSISRIVADFFNSKGSIKAFDSKVTWALGESST